MVKIGYQFLVQVLQNGGDIIGDILNQSDLIYKFDELQDNIDGVNDNLDTHINNSSNPHGVTASQIGLGNVDNTSDIEKPVSNPQREYITEQIKSTLQNITKNEYEALETKNENTYYIITDLDNQIVFMVKFIV